MWYMWQRHWCRQLSLSFRSTHNGTTTKRHNSKRNNAQLYSVHIGRISHKSDFMIVNGLTVQRKTLVIRIETGCELWTSQNFHWSNLRA